MANVGVTKCAHFRLMGTIRADWAWRVKQARNAGLKPIINLIYTVSPRHTDEYFAPASPRRRFALDVYRVIFQGPGRHLDSRKNQDCSAGGAEGSRREDRGIAHRLHDGTRHALLPGSDQSRHDPRQHRRFHL